MASQDEVYKQSPPAGRCAFCCCTSGVHGGPRDGSPLSSEAGDSATRLAKVAVETLTARRAASLAVTRDKRLLVMRRGAVSRGGEERGKATERIEGRAKSTTPSWISGEYVVQGERGRKGRGGCGFECKLLHCRRGVVGTVSSVSSPAARHQLRCRTILLTLIHKQRVSSPSSVLPVSPTSAGHPVESSVAAASPPLRAPRWPSAQFPPGAYQTASSDGDEGEKTAAAVRQPPRRATSGRKKRDERDVDAKTGAHTDSTQASARFGSWRCTRAAS